MDAEKLSRIQFAFTASFHFLYPPLSMGLGLMLVAFGIAFLRTKDPKWRRLSFFWTKIYGLIFALGVATGIVQEFEFGMNWATYSRFVGNVFGSLLAAEGVFAFFLEGGFLGLMLFGGTRLGPRLWLGATIMVVFAAHFSALWILMANSWMQTPDGYELVNSKGFQQAEMTKFVDVMFTPSFIPRLLHTWVASWIAGTALVLSVSAFYILRNREVDLAKATVKLALPVFAVLAVLQVVLFGANQAIEATDYQPLKLAAMEGVWEDQSCAPMFLFGWVNESAQTTKGVSIPCLLSFLAYQDKDATVTGLTSFPEDQWPSVNLVFQAYHLMLDLGTLFAALGVFGGVLYLWKRKIFEWRWVLWLFVVNVALTEVAIIAGWWTTETGRQPWIVWQLLKTADAVSPTLSTGEVAFSLGMFIVLYALLFVLFLYLLTGMIKRGPAPAEDLEDIPVASLPDTFREIFRHHGQRASGAGAADPSPARNPVAARNQRGQAMSLNDVWFWLFIFIVAGYLILDGFDTGVGILHLLVAKTDGERRLVLNSIGPVWDGNGVWLVLCGGVLFGAFPLVYASLFSGFYTAFFLVLLVIILRTVSIEFRSKRPSPGWRRTWDVVFSLASLALALLLGVAFGNIMTGVELDAQGNIHMSLIDLLNPFALLVGVTAAAMFALHGSIFLTMKTEGELRQRVLRIIPRATVVFFGLATLTVLTTALSRDEVRERYVDDIWPVILPAAALGAFAVAWRMLREGRYLWAFVGSAAMIAMLVISGAVGMFPNLLISSIDEQYNLTADNAASASNTLEVILIIAVIGIPLVLLYTTGVYYFFRGKTALESDSY